MPPDPRLTVYIEQQSGYHLGGDGDIVARVAKARGTEVHSVPLSKLQKGRVDLSGAYLVAGSIPFIKAALRQRKIDLPNVDCYPVVIRPLLRRTVRGSTLGAALTSLDGRSTGLFVKPSERSKRFTGFVVSDPTDHRLADVPRGEPVWVSEPVQWVSEWRVYVVRSELRSIAFYDGDPAFSVDRRVIEEGVRLLASDPSMPRSYAVDFGVLADGSTALVEMNDGYSVGAYADVEDEVFFDMLIDRWQQLVIR